MLVNIADISEEHKEDENYIEFLVYKKIQNKKV